MRTPLLLLAGLLALSACGTTRAIRTSLFPPPGNTVTFLSGNASSVVIDYGTDPAGEVQYANEMAKERCALFGKSRAKLESINTRASDTMRAIYTCE
jgi:hypothetical protein